MGLHTLIEAMPAIVAKVPEVLLCIGGRGPMLAELTAMVEQRGLKEHVRFLGFVADEMLPHLYRAADLSVVPTRALEGFGLVAAESIAAGTPALVTPIGGLPEVVSGLSPHLIFKSPEAPDLTEGIVQALLGSVTLPDDAACRGYVQANFTSALMAERTAAVYRELL
jgi:glycosyltransferase involved in cell wall biosynthesis